MDSTPTSHGGTDRGSICHRSSTTRYRRSAPFGRQLVPAVLMMVVVGGITLMSDPATAVTSKQVEREIKKVRHELVLIQEYAEKTAKGKPARLARTTCEGLRDHAHNLTVMTKPSGMKPPLWSGIQEAATLYEQAGTACVALQLPQFVDGLVKGGAAVKYVRQQNLKWGRMFGDGAIEASY